jgi:PKD repeat protein
MSERFTVFVLTPIILFSTILIFVPTTSAIDLIVNTIPGVQTSVMEGEEITFIVEINPAIDPDDVVLQWYLNGTPVPGGSTTFTYAPDFYSAGSYAVTVFVLHNASSESHQWNLTVFNVEEKFHVERWLVDGEVMEDVAVVEGDPLFFSTEIYNPSGEELQYRWKLDGFLLMGEDGRNFTFTPGPFDQGIRTVGLEIEGRDNVESHKWRLWVYDGFETAPQDNPTMHEGDEIELRVVSPLVSPGLGYYRWSVDGNVQGSEEQATYVYKPDYTSTGFHQVGCEVQIEDASENVLFTWNNTWIVEVLNTNRPPVVEAGKVIKKDAGEKVVLEGVATDPDNDIVSYDWDFDGDGVFDHLSDVDGKVTHTYSKPGVYLATFRVTDSEGVHDTGTFQVVISQAQTLNGWAAGAGIVALLLVLTVVWVFTTRRKRIRAEERARKQAELEEALRGEREEKLALREAARREREADIFEDVEEEPVEDLDMEPDFDMIPYYAQLPDKGQEAEGEADETEISTVAGGPVVSEAPEAEEKPVDEKEELDDILSSLTMKAETAEKADLKVKRASADLGAEDTEGDISMRPKEKKSRKIKRPIPAKVEKPGVSKEADADMGADETSAEIQEFMDILKQVEEKERHKKKERR